MKQRYDGADLRRFTARALVTCDVPEEDAELAASILVAADARGIESHGIDRLGIYVASLRAGRVNPRPKMQVVAESASTATVDGDKGLGLVVAPWATKIAAEKAKQSGSGWISVRNSNHFGIAGYYVMSLAAQELIGFAMTNTTAFVSPLFGAEPMLGTNPIAMAFPGHREPPIVIDMSTSVASTGAIYVTFRAGRPIPSGWMIDARGRDTVDNDDLDRGGSLVPLGGDRIHGGHKGYCLGAAIDLLSGVLSGAGWGPFVPAFNPKHSVREPPVGLGVGHLIGALSIKSFMPFEVFGPMVDRWIEVFRATKPAEGAERVLIPGNPEREAEKESALKGVALVPRVVERLREVAGVVGIDFDSYCRVME